MKAIKSITLIPCNNMNDFPTDVLKRIKEMESSYDYLINLISKRRIAYLTLNHGKQPSVLIMHPMDANDLMGCIYHKGYLFQERDVMFYKYEGLEILRSNDQVEGTIRIL